MQKFLLINTLLLLLLLLLSAIVITAIVTTAIVTTAIVTTGSYCCFCQLLLLSVDIAASEAQGVLPSRASNTVKYVKCKKSHC